MPPIVYENMQTGLSLCLSALIAPVICGDFREKSIRSIISPPAVLPGFSPSSYKGLPDPVRKSKWGYVLPVSISKFISVRIILFHFALELIALIHPLLLLH